MIKQGRKVSFYFSACAYGRHDECEATIRMEDPRGGKAFVYTCLCDHHGTVPDTEEEDFEL